MFSVEGWTDKDVVEVVAQELTTKVVPYIWCSVYLRTNMAAGCKKLSLLVISSCGFGFSFNWASPPVAPGNDMTIREAFGLNSEWVVFTAIAPKWIYQLPVEWFVLFVSFVLL
jgi:hypothetical protein